MLIFQGKFFEYEAASIKPLTYKYGHKVNNNLDKTQFIIFPYNINLDNRNKIQYIARIHMGNLVFIYFNDKA